MNFNGEDPKSLRLEDWQDSIKFLNDEEKHLLNFINNQLKIKSEWKFTVKLKKQKDLWEMERSILPKRNLFFNKIPPNSCMWNNIGLVLGYSAETIYHRYQLIRRNLTLLSQYYKTKDKKLIRNESGCFCGEYNNGFMMIECFTCRFWFHPECLGLWDESEEVLQEKKIICYYCK